MSNDFDKTFPDIQFIQSPTDIMTGERRFRLQVWFLFCTNLFVHLQNE